MLRASYPAPELPLGPRSSLIVATTRYADPSLQQLRAPSQDAAALSAVLGDPGTGAFEVTQLIDQSSYELRMGIERYLGERTIDDLLVVYMSCHGLLDRRGRLYFAATDTEKAMLSSTGVASSWLFEQLEECRAAQQVVILDCCFSGAFDPRSKGDVELDLSRLLGAGRGQAVLTASRKYEYSFEGDSVDGDPQPSVFTAGLIEGLRGAADTEHKGFVSVDDAYDYAFHHVRKLEAHQTPQRWLYGAEGKIWLARNPAGRIVVSAELPGDVLFALQSRYPPIRIGATEVLAEWLIGSDPGRRLTAAAQLREIADSDQPRVALVARQALNEAEAAPDELTVTSDPTRSELNASGTEQGRRPVPEQRGPNEFERGDAAETSLSSWRPATDAEVAMRDALRSDDQAAYFRILAKVDLLLPVSADALAGIAPLGWGTWTPPETTPEGQQRTHVLAFTSTAALQSCLANYTGSARRVSFAVLNDTWPNLDWWLAVNPGLPIEGYLPSWFVAQVARGDVRLPQRAMKPGQAAG